MSSSKFITALKILGVALLLSLPSWSQTVDFNCTSWATTGTCGLATSGQNFVSTGFPVATGGQINMLATGSTHLVGGVGFHNRVGTLAFSTNIQFIMNGMNLAFVLQNNLPSAACNTGAGFDCGAGCEAGMFQSSVLPQVATNIFALEFDSFSPLTLNGSFSYSSVQIYQTTQSPCSTAGAESEWYGTTKISTSPVALNSPAGSVNTTTGDVYSATIDYDGSNVNICMFDVTLANGSCSSGSSGTGTFFQHTWTNVSIPSLVNGSTAFPNLTAATGLTSSFPLLVTSWSYTETTPTASPGSTVTTGGAPAAANPTFSPVAGTYTGTQNVTISCSTAGSYAVYNLASAGQTVLPLPDNFGGAAPSTNNGATGAGSRTLYTGPVAISSSDTLYATCGMNNNITTPSALPANLPSGFVSGAFTINASSPGNQLGPGVKASKGVTFGQ